MCEALRAHITIKDFSENYMVETTWRGDQFQTCRVVTATSRRPSKVTLSGIYIEVSKVSLHSCGGR